MTAKKAAKAAATQPAAARFHVPRATSDIVVPSAAPRVGVIADRSVPAYKGKGPKGYKRSNEHIRSCIEEALAADPTVDPSDIRVTVQNGKVRLQGRVAGRRTRYAAVAVAEAYSGTDVDDALESED